MEHGQDIGLVNNRPDFIKDIKIAEPIGKYSKVKNLLLKSVIEFSWPLQCSLYYDDRNKNEISEYVANVKPDVIIVDMVRLATYYDAFRKFNCLKILDMDDLLSNRYERQINGSNSTSIAGQYSSKMSSLENKFLSYDFIKKLVLHLEIKLMKKAEINFGNIYDRVVFVSEKECRKINPFIDNKAAAVPMGVYKDEFIKCTYSPTLDNEICFVGNMGVAANADTLQMLVEKILPLVKVPYKFKVIGKCPKDLLDQYKNYENIVFTGRVESIYEHAKNSSLFLAPIAYGSGIKTKILEAMAMQIPVITNSIGAEGLDMVSGKHYVVKDDYISIANAVDYYLKNKEEAKKLAVAGQKSVFETYEWNSIWNRFEHILNIS